MALNRLHVVGLPPRLRRHPVQLVGYFRQTALPQLVGGRPHQAHAFVDCVAPRAHAAFSFSITNATTSPTVRTFSASSSVMTMSNVSSSVMMISKQSRLSAPRSSTI